MPASLVVKDEDCHPLQSCHRRLHQRFKFIHLSSTSSRTRHEQLRFWSRGDHREVFVSETRRVFISETRRVFISETRRVFVSETRRTLP